MIAVHLRRFDQKSEWDVHQVLLIRTFFMSATHLHHSDNKLGIAVIAPLSDHKSVPKRTMTSNVTSHVE